MKRIILALFSTFALLLTISIPASAQGESAPTVGEIVVDSYDCDTGRLSFHVPVTDLPHIPDSNGPLGYSVSAQYEQGSDLGLPSGSFNPEPQEAPYTGDVDLSTEVAPNGADSTSPESASGPLVSVDISVSVGSDGGTDPSDTSSTTYPVDCGDAPVPTSPEGDEGDDATTEDETATEDEATTDESESDTATGSDTDTDGGTTSELPNTGVGTAATNGEQAVLVTVLGFASIAALLFVAGVRFSRRA